MNRHSLMLALALLILGPLAGKVAAQDSCMSLLQDCVRTSEEREGACAGIAMASSSAGWRDMLAIVLQHAFAELSSKGGQLTDTMRQAAQKGADLEKQVAALNEVALVSKNLNAKLAKGSTSVRGDAVSTPASAVRSQNVNQAAVKQPQLQKQQQQ